MSTAMSTKRLLVVPQEKGKSSTGTALLIMIAGIAMLALGVKFGIAAVLAIGFIATMAPILYFNAMIWGKIFSTRKFGTSLRMSRVMKY